MKFLADECCDAELVEALAGSGYDVLDAVNDLRGASDEQVLERAYHEGRIIITEDKDFGDLVYRLRKPAAGILLLRFGVHELAEKVSRLLELLANDQDRLRDSFVVLESDKVRIRALR